MSILFFVQCYKVLINLDVFVVLETTVPVLVKLMLVGRGAFQYLLICTLGSLDVYKGISTHAGTISPLNFPSVAG